MLSLYCLAVLIHLAGTAMNRNRKLLTLSVALVEVFHAVAATAEHGKDRTYNLAVLIANQSAAKS
jgi:hypothetical protein